VLWMHLNGLWTLCKVCLNNGWKHLHSLLWCYGITVLLQSLTFVLSFQGLGLVDHHRAYLVDEKCFCQNLQGVNGRLVLRMLLLILRQRRRCLSPRYYIGYMRENERRQTGSSSLQRACRKKFRMHRKREKI
jgi:hypothetical protein